MKYSMRAIIYIYTHKYILWREIDETNFTLRGNGFYYSIFSLFHFVLKILCTGCARSILEN